MISRCESVSANIAGCVYLSSLKGLFDSFKVNSPGVFTGFWVGNLSDGSAEGRVAPQLSFLV